MSLFIYLIAFLEWFTTLSIEIIALRIFTPIVGTNSVSTSIILWVILLALSYGYYIWWKISQMWDQQKLKEKIAFNLSFAALYYLFFSFIVNNVLLTSLLDFTSSYFWSILLASIILFFLPVFLASQTIPLLSEMLKGNNSGEKIGKLLFFSTVGSFAGSLFTSVFLFAWIGVDKSAVLNSLILSALALALLTINLQKISKYLLFSMCAFASSILFLSYKEELQQNMLYKSANAYHDIQITDWNNNLRIFSLNQAYSSGIDHLTKQSFFQYIIELKQQIITNQYENIAVIWAAWFTLPYELSSYNFVENLDVIDVDKDLKNIAETYFLEEKLSKKINFIVQPSRYFLHTTIQEGKKYDAVVVDIYVWQSLPPQTLTLEFFEALKQISDNIYINMITDAGLKSDFSQHVFNTMNQAFWDVYYKDVNHNILPEEKTNLIITNKEISQYHKYVSSKNTTIYTDNQNSIELDLFRLR